MKRRILNLIIHSVLGLSLTVAQAGAEPEVLRTVPAYRWYHGCGPSAAGSIIGYWDLHGYNGLFTASGWTAVRDIGSVKEEISSDAHNAAYDNDDSSPPPEHPPDTSIADFFQTSEGPFLPFGWSMTGLAPTAFNGYARHRGYPDLFAVTWKAFSGFSWEDLVTEIDAGRPLMVLVQQTHNSVSDHFIPVVGYDDRGAAGRFYGFYSVQDNDAETVQWAPFTGTGASWGIKEVFTIRPQIDPDPRTLSDAIQALKAAAGLDVPGLTFHLDANGDGSVGVPDAVGILQETAGLRP